MADEEDQEVERERLRQRDLPSVWIDTWSTLTFKGHVRVSLGEEFAEGAFYRSAFIMDLDQAEAFALHLYGAVQKRKAKEEATAAKALATAMAEAEAKPDTPEQDS